MSFDLAKRRKECGLTLEDIANRLGVTKSTVQKWENGTIASMKSDKVLPLARTLGISPMALLEKERCGEQFEVTAVLYCRNGEHVCEVLTREAHEYLTKTIEMLKNEEEGQSPL